MESFKKKPKLTSNEEHELAELSHILGVQLDSKLKTRETLEWFHYLSHLIKDGLPELDAAINLQKSEICHFYCKSVDWIEERAVGASYNGVGARLKIAKGLYLRSGSISINTQYAPKIVDSGEAYLTNKRIVFVGNKSGKSIRLNKVVGIATAPGVILIKKDTGKHPLLSCPDADALAILLGKLLNSV